MVIAKECASMSDSESKAEQLAALRSDIAIFVASTGAIPSDAFLRVVTEWSPRDVVAHLIGWNVYTLDGCRDIQEGRNPFYLTDEAEDFKNVNAASTKRYASQEKSELLDQLTATADELLRYLDELEPAAWNRDYGVAGLSGRPSLISQHVAALAADYLGHAQEISSWTGGNH
jgi:hypothetical protein